MPKEPRYGLWLRPGSGDTLVVAAIVRAFLGEGGTDEGRWLQDGHVQNTPGA